MNIALPALVVLLGILPGIAFFYTYFAGRFDKRQAGVGGAEELALYIVFAVPIDAAALWLCRVFGIDLNFSITAQLLSGTLSDIAAVELATIFRQNAYLTAVTYAVILLGAAIAGSIVRRFVWASRLDTRLPYLRLHNDWFYVLHGRQSHLPREVVTFVDVLTTHPDGSRLYKGAVVHFEVGASGTLQTLTLIYPQRGKSRGQDFQWVEIPSDRLTIMGSTIHSLNIGYVSVEPEQPVHSLRRWWLSFWREQP